MRHFSQSDAFEHYPQAQTCSTHSKPFPVPVVQDQADEDESSLGGSVTMSRALAVSAHGLTLNEARVMMLACRLIDPRKAPHAYARDGYVKVRVTADEFAQLANMAGDGERTPTAAYEGLKAACDKLFERRASWREEENDEARVGLESDISRWGRVGRGLFFTRHDPPSVHAGRTIRSVPHRAGARPAQSVQLKPAALAHDPKTRASSRSHSLIFAMPWKCRRPTATLTLRAA